ncbi:MAG: radical SAM protein [Chloroflexi bacterium]|nr:radical SAM protein [Chloroflexota bacterium]
MLKRLADWLKERIQGRPFEAFQIEVTSRCNLRCEMCPKRALGDEWVSQDLPWDAFQRIATTFGQSRHIHLQGWGEPLLHSRLFDMIRLAKERGCRVGLTTNGTLLDRAKSVGLLDAGLDLMAVSIAGATRETHERIRVGSDLSTILENVQGILSLRASRKRKTPKLELSYLMTKTNMAELLKTVELAAALGVDELYAINLDYVVTPEHEELKVFDCPGFRQTYSGILDAARETARRNGLTFRAYPLESEEVAVCEENPLRILFVSADGWVSPCTYMGLAGRTDIPRRFQGRSASVRRLRFGNVLDQGLLDIWNSPAYRTFRQEFETRRLELGARALLVVSGGEQFSDMEMPPAPAPCRTCYKLYGL